jgi:contractile injection system tube protein/LysM domain-containing protein
MTIAKLTIKNLDSNKDPFEVLFNPTEYTFEDASKWQEHGTSGWKPELQYTGGDRRRLSMELFYDTYEQDQDVRLYTGKLAALLVVSTNDGNDGKRPPKLELSWGKKEGDTGFPFVCVLETLKQQFTMFTEEGTPVRAKCSVSFKEFILPKEEQQREPRRGSYPEQTYTVREGETLASIAAALWKDPRKWRLLANANGIRNPRILQAGQSLQVPAIE